jgi:hypothetical protein
MKDWLKSKATELADNVKSVEIGDKKIGDYTKPLEDMIDDTVYKHSESKKEQTIDIYTKKMFSKTPERTVLRKDINNLFYISNRYDENATRYTFERISWGGSSYTQTTITSGEAKTQGRMGSAIIGAGLAGAPGAMIGASRSKKTKINTTSKTTTQENGSQAIIYLRNSEDGSIKEIKTAINTAGFNNLQQFFS